MEKAHKKIRSVLQHICFIDSNTYTPSNTQSANAICEENFTRLTSLTIGLVLVFASAKNALAQESALRYSEFLDIASLALFIPGLIILFVRSRFLTGRIGTENTFIYYVAVSVIYWLIVNFLFIQKLDYRNPGHMFLFLLVGPIISGVLVGYSDRKGYIRRLFRWAGLGNLTLPIPSAWDWKFTDMEEEWILVTLKDGTRFAGFFGESSFASSDPQRRDVYIQWIYDLDEKNNWIYPKSEKSLLIAADEIRTIEFFPYPDESIKEVGK